MRREIADYLTMIFDYRESGDGYLITINRPEGAMKKLGYTPHTPIAEGIPKFVEWYKDYHRSR